MARSISFDVEAPLTKVRRGSKLELRLWLRMLACVNLVSGEIRRRLRSEFNLTLPQFDVLAQLQREPDGLRPSQLSERMMVTKGNLTGIVDTLVAEGFVTRAAVPGDRRALNIKLSASGAKLFQLMAAEHERWLAEFYGDLDKKTLASLIDELDQIKRSFHARSRR
jgi:DNA-binding MarR family transcriptional regulator